MAQLQPSNIKSIVREYNISQAQIIKEYKASKSPLTADLFTEQHRLYPRLMFLFNLLADTSRKVQVRQK